MAEKDPLRIIWSDVAGINCLTDELHRNDLRPGVYALVGPIDCHTAEPELQDALGMIAVRRNRRFGLLRFGKFVALLRSYGRLGRRYVRD